MQHQVQAEAGGTAAGLHHDWREVAAGLRAIVDSRFVVADAETMRPYECDGLPMYREMPQLVVLPGSVDEASEVLRYCHARRIPVVARGGGTGLSAGATPHKDGIVLSLSRLDRILDIDPAARSARVEPGVTNLAISEAAQAYGLYYAPDPSSQIACTIGGNVAENSGGVHCLKYGLTIHNLLEVRLLTVEGDELVVGSGGYDAAGLDLLALITGSEGLLGVVVEVTVRLLPVPPAAQLVVAAFGTSRGAGEAVSGVITEGIVPAGLEMMDNAAIRAAEDFVGVGYPVDAAALLLCELDGTPEEVASGRERVVEVFRAFGASEIRVSRSEAERQLLWKGRKAAFPAVGRIAPDYYCMDGTIPRKALADVLTAIGEMSERYGLRVANVFHAGDGNMHPLILFDANQPGDFAKAEAFGGDILELCVRHGGCITGEHGVGIEKLRQVPLQFNEAELVQLGNIKIAFDPFETLNPGKGIPILHRCQEYRALARAGRDGADG